MQPLNDHRLKIGLKRQHRQPIAWRADPPNDQPAQIGTDEFDQRI